MSVQIVDHCSAIMGDILKYHCCAEFIICYRESLPMATRQFEFHMANTLCLVQLSFHALQNPFIFYQPKDERDCPTWHG